MYFPYKLFTFGLLFALNIPGSFSQPELNWYFRSVASGNWNSTATWEASPDGSAWNVLGRRAAAAEALHARSAGGARPARARQSRQPRAIVEPYRTTQDFGGADGCSAWLAVFVFSSSGFDRGQTVNAAGESRGSLDIARSERVPHVVEPIRVLQR